MQRLETIATILNTHSSGRALYGPDREANKQKVFNTKGNKTHLFWATLCNCEPHRSDLKSQRRTNQGAYVEPVELYCKIVRLKMSLASRSSHVGSANT